MRDHVKQPPSFVRLFVAGFALGAAALGGVMAQTSPIIPAAIAQVAPR